MAFSCCPVLQVSLQCPPHEDGFKDQLSSSLARLRTGWEGGGRLETDGATDAEMSSGEGTEFAAWRPLEKVEPARCECRAGWGSCTPSKAETQ